MEARGHPGKRSCCLLSSLGTFGDLGILDSCTLACFGLVSEPGRPLGGPSHPPNWGQDLPGCWLESSARLEAFW